MSCLNNVEETTRKLYGGLIIISGLPLMERSRFLIDEASSPPSRCWARNTCGTENLWPQFRGKLISRFVPQPLAILGWGRCLAVSMKMVCSPLRHGTLPDFLSGLSSIAPVLSQCNPLGSGGQAYWLAACRPTRQVTSPSEGIYNVS